MAYTTTHFGLLNCTMAVTGATAPSLTTDGISLAGLDETLPGCALMEGWRLRATAAAGNLAPDTALAYESDDGGTTWYRFPAADMAIAGGGTDEALGDFYINAPSAKTRIAYTSAAQSLTFTLYGHPRKSGH